jgi:hypothetical protein
MSSGPAEEPMVEARPANDRSPGSTERGGVSRRDLLRSGSALVAGGVAAQMLPPTGRAADTRQTDVEAELRTLQAQRRILLKGGIVLTLDDRSGTSHEAMS